MPQTPVPKGLTDALRRAMGLGGDVMDALTPEMSPGASNEFLPESIQSVQDWFQQEPEPWGFRDIASTLGGYASMAGLDPGGATGPGRALMSPSLLGKAKMGGGFEKISPAAKAYIKGSTKTLGKKFPKGDPTGDKYRKALATSLRRKLRVEMDPEMGGTVAGTYNPQVHRISLNPKEMARGEAGGGFVKGSERVSDRELMHSVWEFIPQDSKRVITRAVKQGDFPTHPDLKKAIYKGADEQLVANESFSHYLADWARGIPAKTAPDKKMYKILDDLLPAKDPLLKAMGQ